MWCHRVSWHKASVFPFQFCKLCDEDCPCETSKSKPNCDMCKVSSQMACVPLMPNVFRPTPDIKKRQTLNPVLRPEEWNALVSFQYCKFCYLCKVCDSVCQPGKHTRVAIIVHTMFCLFRPFPRNWYACPDIYNGTVWSFRWLYRPSFCINYKVLLIFTWSLGVCQFAIGRCFSWAPQTHRDPTLVSSSLVALSSWLLCGSGGLSQNVSSISQWYVTTHTP